MRAEQSSTSGEEIKKRILTAIGFGSIMVGMSDNDRITAAIATAKEYAEKWGGHWGEHDFVAFIWEQGGLSRGAADKLGAEAYRLHKAGGQ